MVNFKLIVFLPKLDRYLLYGSYINLIKFYNYWYHWLLKCESPMLKNTPKSRRYVLVLCPRSILKLLHYIICVYLFTCPWTQNPSASWMSLADNDLEIITTPQSSYKRRRRATYLKHNKTSLRALEECSCLQNIRCNFFLSNSFVRFSVQFFLLLGEERTNYDIQVPPDTRWDTSQNIE